jgi:pimeloyl-ACP methyl ester carboxylesterase
VTDTELPAAEQRIRVNGIELNVASAGSGDSTVLLLHGFPDSWQSWRHQIAALAEAGHRVIAPDLRGFGESDRPPEVSDYAMPTLLADVNGLLDHFGIERAAVVGHDWGAGLAWQVAMRAPDRVERLAVVSVGHGGASAAAGLEQRRLSWYMLWFLFPGVAEAVLPANDWRFFREWAWNGAQPGENPDCDRQIANLSRPGALTAALNWYRANISPRRFVATEAINGPMVACPTMGVWSSGDQFLGEQQLAGSARYVTGPWRYERLAGSHWVTVEAAEPLSRLLVDFLD